MRSQALQEQLDQAAVKTRARPGREHLIDRKPRQAERPRPARDVYPVGAAEGLFVAPEGAACFAALKTLLREDKIKPHEQVVVFNTGSGVKYLDCYAV